MARSQHWGLLADVHSSLCSRPQLSLPDGFRAVGETWTGPFWAAALQPRSNLKPVTRAQVSLIFDRSTAQTKPLCSFWRIYTATSLHFFQMFYLINQGVSSEDSNPKAVTMTSKAQTGVERSSADILYQAVVTDHEYTLWFQDSSMDSKTPPWLNIMALLSFSQPLLKRNSAEAPAGCVAGRSGVQWHRGWLAQVSSASPQPRSGTVRSCLNSLWPLRSIYGCVFSVNASLSYFNVKGLDFVFFKCLGEKKIKRLHGCKIRLWLFTPICFLIKNVTFFFNIVNPSFLQWCLFTWCHFLSLLHF